MKRLIVWDTDGEAIASRLAELAGKIRQGFTSGEDWELEDDNESDDS
jgi:hypothetical protein